MKITPSTEVLISGILSGLIVAYILSLTGMAKFDLKLIAILILSIYGVQRAVNTILEMINSR